MRLFIALVSVARCPPHMRRQWQQDGAERGPGQSMMPPGRFDYGLLEGVDEAPQANAATPQRITAQSMADTDSGKIRRNQPGYS